MTFLLPCIVNNQ